VRDGNLQRFRQRDGGPHSQRSTGSISPPNPMRASLMRWLRARSLHAVTLSAIASTPMASNGSTGVLGTSLGGVATPMLSLRLEAVITHCTVISPRVSVPVMSDAMMNADPSVSTDEGAPFRLACLVSPVPRAPVLEHGNFHLASQRHCRVVPRCLLQGIPRHVNRDRPICPVDAHDPLRSHQHIVAEPPVACAHHHVSDVPGLVIEVDILHVAEGAIDGNDSEILQVFRLAKHGFLTFRWFDRRAFGKAGTADAKQDMWAD